MNETFAEIRRLMLATNRIDGAYYLLSRKLGVKENILALLYALDDEETHSQKRICEDWLFPKTTINTIIRGTGPSGLCNALPGGEWPGETHCFDPGGERLRQQNAEGRIPGGTGCHGKDATTIFSTVCGCLWTTLPIASAVSWIIGCQNRKTEREFPTWERAG